MSRMNSTQTVASASQRGILLRQPAAESAGILAAPLDDLARMSPEDLRRALRELRVYQLVFGASSTANSIANAEGILTEANEAFLKTWRYADKNEVVGKPITHFHEDPNEAEAMVTTLHQTGYWQGSYAAKRGDGSSFIAHGLASVMRDGLGEVIGFQSAVLAASKRSRTETALEEFGRRYWALFEGAAEGILMVDLQTRRFQYANPAICRMLEYTSQELIHLSVADIHPPEISEQVLAVLDGMVHTHHNVTELPCQRKDGGIFEASINMSIVAIGDRMFLVGFFIDITQRKRAEAALAKSLNLLAETERLGKVGGWELDLDTKDLTWTAQVYRIHEVESTYQPTVDQAIGFYTPACRAVVERAVRRAIEHGESFDLELEIITAKGNLRVVHALGKADWKHRRVYGCFQDITERRRMEAALANSRRLLAETERLGKVGGWEFDIDTNQQTWTEEIYRIHEVETTYDPTVGKGINFYTPASRPLIERAVQRAIEHGESFDLELEIITAKGNLRSVHSVGHADLEHRRIYGFFQDITERKQVEMALLESEVKYRKLHESMMDAFVSVDMTGRILEYNRVYQEMLGYPDEELHQLAFSDITPEKWHALEDRLVAEQIVPRGYSDLYQKEYRRKDGTIIPVELRTFLIRDGDGNPLSMWAVVRDITKRKLAEETMREWNQTLERRVAERTLELQQSETRFHQLAEATFEGLGISENGILIDGNAQLGEMHGYELAEMIGRPVMDFIAPESRAVVAKAIRSGVETPYELIGLRKDGSKFPVEAHSCMRTWHGKKTRVTALRDLTELKQSAARLQAQQTELEHAHRLALVSEISAGIIHQIGQPLCAMGANLAVAMAMLKNGPAECHETMEILGEVERDVDNMRDVTTHMRALAHAVQPNHQSVDFNQLLEDALQLLRQEAANCGFQLAVDLGHDLPPVQADVVQLDQVILHLTRNAFEACVECPPDRRTIAITTRVVADVDVELSVCDRGIGITPDAMERMFWPFFTTKADALGIGLRLSRTIVEAHGGRIEADNNADGFGATFRVILPGNAPRHHANL